MGNGLNLFFVAHTMSKTHDTNVQFDLVDGPFISKDKAKTRLKELGQPENAWEGRHCVIKSELDSRMTHELERYE